MDNEAVNNDSTANDGNEDIPPKVKPAAAAMAMAAKKKAPAAKKTTGDKSNKVAAMLPRAPAKNKNFSIDATDRFLVAYFGAGFNDYANVAIMVN